MAGSVSRMYLNSSKQRMAYIYHVYYAPSPKPLLLPPNTLRARDRHEVVMQTSSMNGLICMCTSEKRNTYHASYNSLYTRFLYTYVQKCSWGATRGYY